MTVERNVTVLKDMKIYSQYDCELFYTVTYIKYPYIVVSFSS